MKLQTDTKLGFFEKITLWWKFEGRYYHKDFATGVKNLWKWFPVIWKDRDHDHHYIYEVLKFKLDKQAECISARDRFVESHRRAEVMRLVSRLIKLHQDEFYQMEYMDYHVTEYEFIPTDETEKWFTMQDTLISENFDDYFKKYPRQYKRVVSGEVSRFKKSGTELTKEVIAMEISMENYNRCRKLLFKILEENIETWWH